MRGSGMRLSLQSRNSVKHRSASVEIANQTGDRILTVRLEFNYKNRPKLSEARCTNFESIFYGPYLTLCLFVGGFPRLSETARLESGVCYSRLGSCYVTFIKEVRH